MYRIIKVILLISLSLIVSCKAKQPIKEVTIQNTDRFDSVFEYKTVDRNLAIIDSLTMALGKVKTIKPECDTVCQIALDNILGQLNIKKQSGVNSYSIKYDKDSNTIYIAAKVGETKTSISFKDRYIRIIKTLYVSKEIPVERKLPKWQLWLMIAGAASIGFHSFKLLTFIRSKTI